MRDFFVSHATPDGKWAQWIAYTLEEASYSVYLQAWDFTAGKNFVLEMQKASSDSRTTVMVMSRSYLAALYTHSEWAAAFAVDPKGNDRRLIPVRIESCKFEGLLRPVVWIDLVDKNEQQAIDALLKGVSADRQKPSERPQYPGGEFAVLRKPIYPPDEKVFDRRRLPKTDPSTLSIQAGEHFLDALPAWLSARSGPHSIVFLDIDGQGGINRKFGVAVGDKVIERVSHLLSEQFPQHPIHRCGDDTFCFVVQASLHGAYETAQQVVVALRSHKWSTDIVEGLTVTCSAGLAEFSSLEQPADTVLKAAIGCRNARMAGGNRTSEGPAHLRDDGVRTEQRVSAQVKKVHSGWDNE